MANPTAAVLGSLGQLHVSTNGITYSLVGEVQSIEFKEQLALVSANNHQDPYGDQDIPGRASATLTGSVNLVYDDVGQLIMRNAFINRTRIYTKILQNPVIGMDKIEGLANVLEWGVTMNDNQVESAAVNMKFVGMPTWGVIDAGDLP